MPFVILPTNSASGGYDITNSLRFNHNSSDYLNRTPASSGNRRTFTYSFWTKRSEGGSAYPVLFDNGSNSSNRDSFFFNKSTGDFLQFYCVSGGSGVMDLATTQLFRDFSAWYHIVLAVDTTQATASNRIKLYVNGLQVTAFQTATYPSQNTDMNTNSTNPFRVGGSNTTSYYYDGYLSDYYFIDGQQLTPSSFGESDFDTGIWKPKAYTGTYGTNGFYLKFANSASLGTDSSGNGNTFTVNNLTSVDQTTDTPTNNFCTLNPLVAGSTGFTEGNLKWTNTSGGWSQRLATFMFSAGKWYAEMKVDTKGDTIKIGIQLPTLLDIYGGGELNNSYFYLSDGRIRNNGSNVTTGLSTFTDGDIIGIAVDVTNSLLYFYKNGTLVNSGGTSITSGQDWVIGCGAYDAGTDNVVSWNFGNPLYSSNSYTDGAGFGNFSYQVPANYFSLCTKNLATYG